MSKLYVSEAVSTALTNARKSGLSRTGLWSGIHAQFGIPSGLRIGVDATRALYVKGTDPRQYLVAGVDGRYSHAQADATASTPTAPATGRFYVSEPPMPPVVRWARVSVADLFDALREGDVPVIDRDPDMPAGFPTDSTDAFVHDKETDDLYFTL